MNKLWVYGCSFSEPFQIETGGADWDERGYRKLRADYWGTHLSKKLGFECVTCSLSGVGWNYITEQVDRDILDWDKTDIIIISPSFFSRVTFEELEKRDIQGSIVAEFKPWDFVASYNEHRWKRKVDTLQHFGYNVYTWVVDEPRFVSIPNKLIHAPGGFISWKDWMDLNKQYWQDPTTNKYPLGDWHFNEQGHIAVADRMYDVICKKQQ
jgi:hypothetical protein